ncbi:MAG: MBL fold metallo-hydrolase [Bacteroidota bacterium]
MQPENSNSPVWQIKFYGTRGSIPVCDKDYQIFGGNTSCIYFDVIANPNSLIGILDAGSGIRNLGKDIISGKIPYAQSIFISFSHFHWDHIQGLPFFAPAYDPEQEIVIYAPHKSMDNHSLKQVFEVQMLKEYFPVQLEEMSANIRFHTAEQFRSYLDVNALDEFKTNLHNHPGGAYGYRIEANGKSVVVCTDIEHGVELDEKVIKFCEGADLLIHEAQYTSEELEKHRGWGHSSYEQAVEVARAAGVKRLIMTHHDPDHNDEFLMRQEKKWQKVFNNCALAREGIESMVFL